MDNRAHEGDTGIYATSIYTKQKCLFVCLSCLEEVGGLLRETGRIDRKEGGNGEVDFFDGMPAWTYFSRAAPGHPASTRYI